MPSTTVEDRSITTFFAGVKAMSQEATELMNRHGIPLEDRDALLTFAMSGKGTEEFKQRLDANRNYQAFAAEALSTVFQPFAEAAERAKAHE